MNNYKHPLFDSIFSETHKELETFNIELEKLREAYQTNYNSDDESDEDCDNFLKNQDLSSYTSQFEDFEVNDIDNCFTIDQIEEFRKIYILHPMQSVIDNDIKQKDRLDKQDNQAFLVRLAQTKCCQQSCLSNKVDSIIALSRFLEIKAMSYTESNICFLGMIDASTKEDNLVYGVPKVNLTTNYSFNQKKICQKAWLTIHGISRTRWEALRIHYKEHGLTPKIHGLTGQISNSAIPFSIVLRVLRFITNFANQHGLPSPGRSFRDDTKEIIYLPACESKRSLFRIYNSVEVERIKEISLSSFQRIWKRYLPGIKFITARNDLCMTCKTMRFGDKYWCTEETQQKLEEWTSHFTWAQLERENYRTCIANSKKALGFLQLINLTRPGLHNSINTENHLSWDFAEGIQIPYSSQQEGAIYFKSRFKIELFGICEEAIPCQ
ncbi:28970_t:CDS:2, partial [Gigaspora margarita]